MKWWTGVAPVVLANGDLRLKPGMDATLRIMGTERARVLTVPRDAVLSTGERHVLFVRDSANVLVPREVEIGTSSDDRVEVPVSYTHLPPPTSGLV